jgi:hypothetical protein
MPAPLNTRRLAVVSFYMRCLWTWLLLVALVMMSASGCRRPLKANEAAMTPEAAAALAASRANQEVSQRFGRAPFSAEKGEAMLRRDSSGKQHWQWVARVGNGTSDLSATVSFEPDGSQPSVSILTLVSEERLAIPVHPDPPIFAPVQRF